MPYLYASWRCLSDRHDDLCYGVLPPMYTPQAKLLKGKGKPKELVSDLQEQSKLIISHIDGGLW